ncbi:MAG: metal-dependent hydrolase [Archaeoglobaceae archaeon]|nr:metal-dependent hydrolase [Archaeoglobaceae archaeon]MDW8014017.1 metal-dependent hydrolase [Archaeoglobaceae archaeon]
MKIVWLGHSAFLLEGSRKVLIDPFLSGNPLAAKKPDEVDVEFILVTHGHGDHLGDTVEIAKRCKAKVVCIHELSRILSKFGIETIGMNIGGTAKFNSLTVTIVPAVHSADLEDEKGNLISTGNPVGFVVEMDKVKIYHTGDTNVFVDMQLIGELYKPEIMLLPIGDYYTMGIREAVKALELVKPKIAIPMHYNTFPVIKQDPKEFEKAVKAAKLDVKVVILKPGESFEYNKK